MHAYLIIAHNDFYILTKLMQLLDHKDNDLYIHIDKKVLNFDFDYYRSLVKYSNLFFINRLDVRWGDYSQIKCEINLLKEATKRKYRYYHLLSGVDMPLKSQDEIHDFFDKQNKEFITFRSKEGLDQSRIDRINYYHLFFKNARSKSALKVKVSQKIHSLFIKLQKKLNIRRIKNVNDFRDGANWFSITDDLARYVVENEKKIKKQYKHTCCADEIFLQTLVYNSKYYKNLYSYKEDDYKGLKRAIDWNRGAPYTYTINDYEELIKSGMFFARKFSTKIDKKIIDELYKFIKEGK